ncbi:hypothetical protein CEUSTIGMA_g2036.t1 [Chlamydomonas eustigma]|uniref:Protein kinase domain-containing protein n=1 Tax=Chlamydomonas eustigma TaxID=1157962 RepID=A0A250WUT8_9CHLO|nr:hypothetical protein CEUSTIGMA_g2036.t1 [Chlamydomonas eustigma]|eukprot:GAX74588.1 hypothetical protein CEUSTIGMA_g2036.t1 [Chlamydomonas eustigma]
MPSTTSPPRIRSSTAALPESSAHHQILTKAHHEAYDTMYASVQPVHDNIIEGALGSNTAFHLSTPAITIPQNTADSNALQTSITSFNDAADLISFNDAADLTSQHASVTSTNLGHSGRHMLLASGGSLQQQSIHCQVLVNYGANLGQSSSQALADQGYSPSSPFFAGSMTVVLAPPVTQVATRGPQQAASEYSKSQEMNSQASPHNSAVPSLSPSASNKATTASQSEQSVESVESVASWLLSWRFASGEFISSQSDITPDDRASVGNGDSTYNNGSPSAASSQPMLQSYLLSSQLASSQTDASSPDHGGNVISKEVPTTSPQQAVAVAVQSGMALSATTGNEAAFSFVGRKGPSNISLGAQGLGVGIPIDLTFNNLQCSPLIFGADSSSHNYSSTVLTSSVGWGASLQARAMPLIPAGKQPKELAVKYLSIEQGNVSSSEMNNTEFFLSIENSGSNRSVSLGDVQLQYWFEGSAYPTDSSSFSDDSNTRVSSPAPASSKFQLLCIDISPDLVGGCDSLTWSFASGLSNVVGAHYVLNLGFGRSTGYLLPAGISLNSSMALTLFAQTGIPTLTVVQMIVSIQSIGNSPAHVMKSVLDYSYHSAPIISPPPLETNASGYGSSAVILRLPILNLEIPAFVNGELAWGSPPTANISALTSSMLTSGALNNANKSNISLAGATPAPMSSTSSANAVSTSDLQCTTVANNTEQTCELSVVYCCEGETSVTPTIPPNWMISWENQFNRSIPNSSINNISSFPSIDEKVNSSSDSAHGDHTSTAAGDSTGMNPHTSNTASLAQTPEPASMYNTGKRDGPQPLNKGMIIGGAVGGGIATVLLALVITWFVVKGRLKKRGKSCATCQCFMQKKTSFDSSTLSGEAAPREGSNAGGLSNLCDERSLAADVVSIGIQPEDDEAGSRSTRSYRRRMRGDTCFSLSSLMVHSQILQAGECAGGCSEEAGQPVVGGAAGHTPLLQQCCCWSCIMPSSLKREDDVAPRHGGGGSWQLGTSKAFIAGSTAVDRRVAEGQQQRTVDPKGASMYLNVRPGDTTLLVSEDIPGLTVQGNVVSKVQAEPDNLDAASFVNPLLVHQDSAQQQHHHHHHLHSLSAAAEEAQGSAAAAAGELESLCSSSMLPATYMLPSYRGKLVKHHTMPASVGGDEDCCCYWSSHIDRVHGNSLGGLYYDTNKNKASQEADSCRTLQTIGMQSQEALKADSCDTSGSLSDCQGYCQDAHRLFSRKFLECRSPCSSLNDEQTQATMTKERKRVRVINKIYQMTRSKSVGDSIMFGWTEAQCRYGHTCKRLHAEPAWNGGISKQPGKARPARLCIPVLGPSPAVMKARMANIKQPQLELDVDFINEIEPYLGSLLGVGGFGRVYEGLFRGRRVAVKVMYGDQGQSREELMKEVQLCNQFRGCERLVTLLAVSGLGTTSRQESEMQDIVKGAVILPPASVMPIGESELLQASYFPFEGSAFTATTFGASLPSVRAEEASQDKTPCSLQVSAVFHRHSSPPDRTYCSQTASQHLAINIESPSVHADNPHLSQHADNPHLSQHVCAPALHLNVQGAELFQMPADAHSLEPANSREFVGMMPNPCNTLLQAPENGEEGGSTAIMGHLSRGLSSAEETTGRKIGVMERLAAAVRRLTTVGQYMAVDQGLVDASGGGDGAVRGWEGPLEAATAEGAGKRRSELMWNEEDQGSSTDFRRCCTAPAGPLVAPQNASFLAPSVMVHSHDETAVRHYHPAPPQNTPCASLHQVDIPWIDTNQPRGAYSKRSDGHVFHGENGPCVMRQQLEDCLAVTDMMNCGKYTSVCSTADAELPRAPSQGNGGGEVREFAASSSTVEQHRHQSGLSGDRAHNPGPANGPAAYGPAANGPVLSPEAVSFNGRLPPQKQVALIMELVEGGSLAELVHKALTVPSVSNDAATSMDLLHILQVCHDIAAGLACLHPHVIHRDLKPQNVLIDGHGRAKIADFGISRAKDPYKSFVSVTQQGGTPNYMAPELFNGSRIDEKCDIYSLGCIMYECVSRKAPFEDLCCNAPANMGIFQIILAVAIKGLRPSIPEVAPLGLAALIASCWHEDPRRRPSADQVLTSLEALIHAELDFQRLSHSGYSNGRYDGII